MVVMCLLIMACGFLFFFCVGLWKQISLESSCCKKSGRSIEGKAIAYIS